MPFRLRRTGLFALLVTGLTAPLHAAAGAAAGAGPIAIENAWSRATAPGQAVGVGYMTLVNSGATPDTLLEVSTPMAATVQMHETTMNGGVMRMRELTEGIDLPAKSRVELKPGGVHLMLMQLQAPLEPGTSFPVTLRFRNAGKLAVAFRIDSIATEQSRNKSTGVRP
jgi:hypothetical protein